MAPRAPKKEDTPSSTGTPEVLKPKTEKAKVEKAKAEPRPRAKSEKANKEKGEKVEKEKEKVVKPKAVKGKGEKGDGEGKEKEKEKKAVKSDGKAVDKPKVKAVTGDEAVALIVEYLKAQNRPFSATEVSANLHGKVTKTVADKLLKELGEKGTLGMKATNKINDDGEYAKGTQFVFWTPQNASDTATPEELATMECTIAELKASNPILQKELKAQSSKLAMMKAAPTIAQLQDMVDALRVENAAKANKLAEFKSGKVKMPSKEEMVAVERAHRFWSRVKKARKAAYGELEYSLMENGKSREDIREECGVEGDD
ncbi:Meiotic expression up-regulated 13 [Hyphodiscus hymeniophilus]|uniref:Meiotic expression up-regulated 13 n=1 Tax=Hyphodiscus hymeniophilus TaxID=353542 RepID=A0A9P7AV52_9HELO|nr:Meiotic expression up-regulated 13 [Hyphodiscus hymeniophilus]